MKKSFDRNDVAEGHGNHVLRAAASDTTNMWFQEGESPRRMFRRASMCLSEKEREFLQDAMYWTAYHAYNQGFRAAKHGVPCTWNIRTGEAIDFEPVEED